MKKIPDSVPVVIFMSICGMIGAYLMFGIVVKTHILEVEARCDKLLASYKQNGTRETLDVYNAEVARMNELVSKCRFLPFCANLKQRNMLAEK